MYDRTNFIDPEIPNEVLKFTNTEKFDDINELYRTLKTAYNICIEDYIKFPNQNTMEAMDVKYDDDKGKFYSKYIKFAQTCSKMEKELSISGYGGENDIIKIKIRDICHGVDYNFPYGWKYCVQ